MKEYLKKVWQFKKTVCFVFLFGLVVGLLVSNVDRIREAKRIKFWEFELEFKNDKGSERKPRILKAVDKAKAIHQIDMLIEFGKNIPKAKDDQMRSASVYVFQEMQELRNNTLVLLENLGLKESVLYQEALNCPSIDSSLSPRALFAAKHEFINRHVAALESLRKQIEAKE